MLDLLLLPDKTIYLESATANADDIKEANDNKDDISEIMQNIYMPETDNKDK